MRKSKYIVRSEVVTPEIKKEAYEGPNGLPICNWCHEDLCLGQEVVVVRRSATNRISVMFCSGEHHRQYFTDKVVQIRKDQREYRIQRESQAESQAKTG